MKNLHLFTLLGTLLLLSACGSGVKEGPSALRVAALEEPTAIDTATPDFSWMMTSTKAGIAQQDYRIVVATDPSMQNIVWDSGTVASDESVGILYGSTGKAEALKPETDYFWQVSTTDNRGTLLSASSSFSTGLMNPTLAAWSGAKWIGSTEMTLDAASAMMFNISTKMRIVEGTKASLIFGANDFRLSDKFQNVGNVEGENYIRMEVDIEGAGKAEGAKINIYRVGYAKGDSAEKPFLSISKENYPATNLNRLITAANAREQIDIQVRANASDIALTINGEQLILDSGGRRPVTSFIVTPLGRSGNNFNTFPNLNSVGFAVPEGAKAEFEEYALMNIGQGNVMPLLDAKTGAKYDIFKSIKGVSVDGEKITVSGGAMGYADPSHYASLTMLRTEFAAEKKIAKAKLYITAMGAYEFFINGKRVGEDWFNPGMSQYRETLTYHVYDVTEMLKKGDNTLGAIVGPGFFTGYMTFTPANYNFWGDHEALMAKMVVSYEDGTEQTIVSDPATWKIYKDGPIEHASMFQGQRYNAQKEASIAGWNENGYAAEGWGKPEVIAPREWLNFSIVARRDRPIREVERLEAQRVLKTHSERGTTYTYDMGVAMVGVPSVTLPAGTLKEGDVVMLRFGEEIYPGNEDSPNVATPAGVTYESLYGPNGTYRAGVAGRVLHDTYRAAMATDFYTASKADETREVVIEPHFTYRGYRYIQITTPSRTSALPLECVKGIVLSSERVSGEYVGVTSDDSGRMINQLFKNIQRSQLGNFFSIPTDCPQRNERMGWTGDAQAYSRTASYNADVQSFFRQWMVALRNDQGVGGRDGAPAGGIGSTVPTYSRTRDASFADGSTWAAAVCMVPWQVYQQYGDRQIIVENFEAMKQWLDGMHHYKVPGFEALSSRTSGLADWLSVDSRTSSDICNNAIYLAMVYRTAIMADVIGQTEYAAELRARYEAGKRAFNEAYIDPATGMTRSISIQTGEVGGLMDSQSSYATPLAFDLYSDEMTITEGPNAGMSYKAFAAKRLSELATNPSRSGNEGEVKTSGRSGFGSSSMPATNNPTATAPDYTITTGFSGTPNILPALTANGYVEEAYRMFACTDYASWLYPVKLGSTSMWERWNSYELAFQQGGESSMNSFNHFALGSVGSWLYEYHLGITTDSGRGYKEFALQPLPGGSYTSAEGTFHSNYGPIRSAWSADNGAITSYECSVPANTSAKLYLPVEKASVEGFEGSEWIAFEGMATRNGTEVAVFKLASGNHSFKLNGAKWSAKTK